MKSKLVYKTIYIIVRLDFDKFMNVSDIRSYKRLIEINNIFNFNKYNCN